MTEKKQESLYLQLSDELVTMIGNGTYSEGSQLPSERELCQNYGISRTTVRQAIQELTQRGYVTSVQGKGTFVSKPPIQQELLTIYSFDDDMKRLGRIPETAVLDFLRVAASGKLAAVFGVEENTPLYRVLRLRAADGEPLLLETNYLLVDRFESMSEEMLEGDSLYNCLMNVFGLKLTRAEETFEPVLLRAVEARLLNVKTNTLGMLVERISYEGEKVVEFSKSISPGDRFKYHVTLRNQG